MAKIFRLGQKWCFCQFHHSRLKVFENCSALYCISFTGLRGLRRNLSHIATYNLCVKPISCIFKIYQFCLKYREYSFIKKSDFLLVITRQFKVLTFQDIRIHFNEIVSVAPGHPPTAIKQIPRWSSYWNLKLMTSLPLLDSFNY